MRDHESLALLFRYIFTADPKGMLKLWGLCDPSPSVSHNSAGSYNVSLIGEFTSCFGIRILCLDASLEEEVCVFHIFPFYCYLDQGNCSMVLK